MTHFRGVHFSILLLSTFVITTLRADPKEDFESYIFPRKEAKKSKTPNPIQTDEVLILKDGNPIYERYARGFTQDSRHLLWSVTKAFVNSLVGIAEKEGRLDRNDSICKYIHLSKGYRNRCNISIENLLTWTSGIGWNESYDDADPADSSVIQMLFGKGFPNVADFILSVPMTSQAGEVWNYSTGDSTLLMYILKKVYAKESDDFPWTHLFDRLGMQHVTWERDPTGTFIGGSFGYATASDLARLGQLFLNNGVLDTGVLDDDGVPKSEKLFADDWIPWSQKIPTGFFKKRIGFSPGGTPGAQCWSNQKLSLHKFPQYAPDAPTDLYYFEGFKGQTLTIIPSLNIVAVRFAFDDEDDDIKKGKFDYAEYMKRLLIFVGGQQ